MYFLQLSIFIDVQVAVCNVSVTTNCSSVNEVAANLSAIVSNGSVITTQQDVTYIANTIKNLVINIQNALKTEVSHSLIIKILSAIIFISFRFAHLVFSGNSP